MVPWSLRFTPAGATPVGKMSIVGSTAPCRFPASVQASPALSGISMAGVVGVKLAKRARGASPCAGVRGQSHRWVSRASIARVLLARLLS